jgi:hypothetical protein
MAESIAEFASNAAYLEKADVNAQFRDVNLPRDAFKEWAIVCDSIGRGETSLIFRKGGIAEGRDGFHFKFSRFFLFPTFFHEQIERTRLGNDRTLEPNPGSVKITLFVEVDFVRWVRDLALLESLDRFHILKSSVLSERFHYDDREGLHVAFLRAHLITPTWEFPLQRSYDGCRSWVELPQPPIDLQMAPVLPSDEQKGRRSIVLATLQEDGDSGARKSHEPLGL